MAYDNLKKEVPEAKMSAIQRRMAAKGKKTKPEDKKEEVKK